MKATANLYSQDIDLTAENITTAASLLAGKEAAEQITREKGVYIDAPVKAEPNENPYRRRITNPTWGIRKWIKRLIKRIKPDPTQEDISRMTEKKRLALLEKTLKEEARVSSQRISKALADLHFCYIKKDPNGNPTRIRRITFDDIYATEDALWLHVNMHRWPFGVNSDEIIKQEVVNHLSRSVGHKVNVRATPEQGIWYIIERASGMMGIPVHVTIMEMWEKFPPTATGLTIPIGMTNNRKVVFDSIPDMVHLLVAGQTGGGKSNLLNVIICTLVTRNNPRQLQMLLFDAKAGLEFQHYEGLPHLIKIPDVTETGIIEDPDKFAPALNWIINVEAKKRLGLIRGAGHKDIGSYNVRRKEPLPRLIVVIDEWAAAKMGQGGKDAEHELIKGLQLLRAAGIHFIVCTQVPSKEVLGVMARANLPTRICLSCSELSASILVVGDASAVNLGVAGRAVMKKVSNTPIQIPYISEETVKHTVDGVKDGKFEAAMIVKKHDVTVIEMLEWAIAENRGSLRVNEVYSHFSQRSIPRAEILDELKKIEGQTVEIRGTIYTIEPGKGNQPRRLKANEEPKNEDSKETN